MSMITRRRTSFRHSQGRVRYLSNMKGVKDPTYEDDLVLYKGWLPVDDEVNDVERPSLRVTLETLVLESFIDEVIGSVE